jgi:hypothetical protein
MVLHPRGRQVTPEDAATKISQFVRDIEGQMDWITTKRSVSEQSRFMGNQQSNDATEWSICCR